MEERNFFELETKEGSWFHAYLIIGKNKDKINQLVNFVIEKRGCLPADISTVLPDEKTGKQGEIKIEQIKNLLHDLSLSPLGNCRIAVVYNAERLNQSSGNILLKNLEEPKGNITFILAAENNSILPTIKSRCRIIQVNDDLPSSATSLPKFFLEDFVTASLELEKIVKENQAENFLDELEGYYRIKLLETKRPCCSEAITQIEQIRKEIGNNANPRLSLETLFLMLKSTNDEISSIYKSKM